MKCILVPIEFNAATENVLSYVSAFCKDVPVEHIILFKSFHLSVIAKILPDANLVEVGDEIYKEDVEHVRLKLDRMVSHLRKLVPPETMVEGCLKDDKWLPAIKDLIECRKPELVILGNDPHAELNNSVIAEKIVPFAKISTVPVLVVPVDAVYEKLKRVLIPTSFENLDRLRLMQKLCVSHAWLHAEMFVLNVDRNGKYMMVKDEHSALLDQYLNGYHYQIAYSGARDVVKEILHYAKESNVQIIMALPGKHSFLYNLTHQSVTETFALNAHHPVLLLK